MKKMISKLLGSILLVAMVLHANDGIGQARTDGSVDVVDNNVVYELPKTYELMHIAMALTDTSIVTKSGYNLYHEIIDTSSVYFKEVMQHFGAFKTHPLVSALNESFKKSAGNYTNNLFKAYNTSFENGNIKNTKKMPWIYSVVYKQLGVSKKHVNDFAKISAFEAFYEKHRNYYQQMLTTVKNTADVNNQQVWLEQNFPTKYKQYHIVVSPLMYGTHFMLKFKYKGDRQSLMYVSEPKTDTTFTATINTARYIGTVMTEIDHGYVNPVSDKYKKDLKKLMGDENRSRWTGGSFSNSYKNGYKVFNEYMTHAVYLLYTMGKLSASEQQTLERVKISSMIKARKFIKFDDFYTHVKQLYLQKQTNETIADLYPKVLDWCNNENSK
jgi:hypothetical protein